VDAAQAMGQLLRPEPVILKAGTVVKVGGFPFRLVNDAVVEGHHGNLGLSVQGAVGQGAVGLIDKGEPKLYDAKAHAAGYPGY
jgi:hypothetical protein